MTPKTFTGTVIGGSRRASTLGFPTINITLTDPTLSGIYVGEVTHNGTTYPAAVYADPRRGLLEAHLVDCSGEGIVGEVTLAIGIRVRDDKVFKDDESLRQAIEDDVKIVRAHFSERGG